jgi:hypothetical protein
LDSTNINTGHGEELNMYRWLFFFKKKKAPVSATKRGMAEQTGALRAVYINNPVN